MKNITIACPSMSVSYNDATLSVKIKGINQIFEVFVCTSRFQILPPAASQFILGKTFQRKFKRACDARGWANPFVRLQQELIQQENEHQQEKERKEKRASEKAAAEKFREALIEFLENPTQTTREKYLQIRSNVMIIIDPCPAAPEEYNTRESLRKAIAVASYWGQIYDRLKASPVGAEVKVTNRSYYEALHYHNSWFFPISIWDWRNYIYECETRIAVLNSYDA